MADDNMDVDVVNPSPQVMSHLKHASQQQFPAVLNLPAEQLDNVYEQLNEDASTKDWLYLYKSKDPKRMKRLRSTVLSTITVYLSDTEVKDLVLPKSNERQAADILDNFTDDENEEFRKGLRKGLRKNDWGKLLSHPKLYPPVTNKRAIGVPIQLQNAVIDAWGAKYQGKSAKSLLDLIDCFHNQPLLLRYAKIIPIVQSSGTGKSKTVDEIAKTRILFPICIREDIGKNYFAYPPVDEDIRRYFLGAPPASDEMNCKLYLRILLCAIFIVAKRQVRKFAKEAAELLSYKDFAEKFHTFFSDQSNRNSFYKKVIEETYSIQTKGQTPNLIRALKSLTTTLKARSLWPGPKAESFCPILLSMDEVHILFERRDKEDKSEHTLFSRFKSALYDLRTEPVCAIFLSTSNTVSNLASAQDVAPSIRERNDDLELPPPFTELPFDIDLVSKPLVPGKETIHSVGSLAFTVQFGRPMFSATYRSRKDEETSDDKFATDMLEIVVHKLCGLEWPPKVSATLDPSTIAVFSARFLLDLSASASQARKLDEEQVRSHLRMMYSVQRDRRVVVTGSSPEPLIAEAAATAMNFCLKDGDRYMNTWALLGKFVDEGLAPQGTVGELIGRVLSILAMDRAIQKLPLQEQRPLRYQTPIKVTEYYKALLTKGSWEKLRQSVPVNSRKLCRRAGSMTFEKAFSDAYLHFSHYAKANDDTPFQDQYSWALWLRGTAILAQLNQHLTDRGLPIHFADKGSLCPQTMSIIFDQDKTSLFENPCLVKPQSAETLKLFTDGNKILPYIDAVHCYGVTNNQGIIVTPIPGKDPRFKEENNEAPRYRINIRGLDVYEDVQGVADVIRSMIDGTKDALFTHHPRPEAIPLLRQMQPLLNGKKKTTAWFGGLQRPS